MINPLITIVGGPHCGGPAEDAGDTREMPRRGQANSYFFAGYDWTKLQVSGS